VAAIQHPARHYIYYLLSKRIYDAKAVISLMELLGLPVPSSDYELEPLVLEVLRVRATMTFPKAFNPRDTPPNEATLAWLRHWKIRDMWLGSPYLAAATDILSEPHVRHLVELLLLGPLSHNAIATRVAQRFELPKHAMNSAVVRAYSHYYWDPTSMDPGQWRIFIKRYYQSVATEYHAALQAPRSKAGAAFVIAVADKDPQSLSPADRYETASTMAFGMLMHHALDDSRTTGQTYAAFTALNMMRMADEELSKHRGASSDLIDELRRLETVYDKGEPLQITQAHFIHRPLLEVKSTEVTDANDE
jgi:hypothetical protein